MTLLLLLIFAPLLTGAFLFASGHYRFNGLVFALQVFETIALGWLAYITLSAPGHEIILHMGGWHPSVAIAFKLDTISLLFSAMTVIGFWYVWLFIWPDRHEDQKFMFFLATLQGTLLALFNVNDLFTLFVLCETMTILCSILILYKRDAYALRAGLYYLLFNSWGMILYLVGVLWLYQLTGTLDIDVFLSQQALFATHPSYQFAVLFILTAIAIKSAFFPLFFWLPPAHSAAPAAISALLSGLMVKVGLFMLLRLELLSAFEGVSTLLIGMGLISGLFGALFAMLQSDMKRILAFHTISQVGLITFGLGLGGAKGEWGALLHLFNHFTFKSLLFLSVGLIIVQTGERRLKKYHGLWQWSKPLSICLLIGILGITGFPLLNGSFSKLLIKYGVADPLILIALQAINLGTLISFTKLFLALPGHTSDVLEQHAPPNKRQLIAPIFMAVVTLAALPLELWISNQVDASFTKAFFSKWASDSLTFAALALAAYGTYKLILAPIMKAHPHFAHEDVAFSNGITVSILFLAGLSFLLM